MTKRILVAGGGFTGTVAVIGLLRAALTGLTDELQIEWIDKDAAFARGLPYREQSPGGRDPFLLNIPAYMMSPLAEQPELFVEWLNRFAPQYHGFSFTPRALYGRFLESVLGKLQSQVNRHGARANLRRKRAQLTAVHRQSNGIHAKFSGDVSASTFDAIALCLGHERSDKFSKFSHQPGYIAHPYQLANYDAVLRQCSRARDAIIVGGGSSSIDAVRAFEALKFDGQYTIISSSDVAPWGWNAEFYRRRSPDNYRAAYLTPAAAAACCSFDELMELLEAEVRFALANDFGYGGVYFGIKPQQLFAGADCTVDYRSRFLHYFFQCRKAMSAPESVRMLERLSAEGRLRRVVGIASAEESSFQEERFQVAVKGPVATTVTGDLLVNCAQVLRAYQLPLANDLLAKLCANNLLRLTDARLLEHVPNSGIYPLGPMASPPEGGSRYLWSARFFRQEIHSGVQALLGDLGLTQTPVPAALPSTSISLVAEPISF